MSNIDEAMKYFNNGNEYSKKKDCYDETIECYTKAMELFSKVMANDNIEQICSSILGVSDNIPNIYNWFYSIDNYKSVINILKELPESSLLYYQVLLKIGFLYEKHAEYFNALEYLLKIPKDYENYKNAEALIKRIYTAIFTIAQKYYGNLENDKAIEYLEHIPENNSYYASSINILYNMAMRMEDYEKALEILKKVPENHASYAIVQYYIGTVYQTKQEYEKALEYLELIPENNNNYNNSISTICNIANVTDDYEKALEILRKVPKDNKNYGMVQYHIGTVYQIKQKYEKALEYFNKTPEKTQYYQHSQNSIKNVYLGILGEGRNYFIEGNYKKAVELLNKIPENNEHYERAMELINRSDVEGKIKIISYKMSKKLNKKAKELQKASNWYKFIFVALILTGIFVSIWLLKVSFEKNDSIMNIIKLNFTNKDIYIMNFIKTTSTSFVVLGLILWLARFVNRRIHETLHLKEEYAHKAIVLSSVIPYANMINSLSKEDTTSLLDFMQRVSININKSPVSSLNKVKNDNIPINDLTELINAINTLKKIP